VLALALATAVAGSWLVAKVAWAEENEGRGWLGVVLVAEDDEAVRIGKAIEGGPAAAAGLQKNDRILAIDGRSVSGVEDVVEAVRSHRPGEVLTLGVQGEDGGHRTATVTLGERPYADSAEGIALDLDLEQIEEKVRKSLEGLEDFELPDLKGLEGLEGMKQGAPAGYLGIELLATSPALREAFRLPTGYGVLVNEVRPESPAAASGLKAGDLVTAVDSEEITSPGQLRKLIRGRKPGTEVAIEVLRQGRAETFYATLGETKARVFFFDRSQFAVPDMPEMIELPDMSHVADQVREALEQARGELEQLRREGPDIDFEHHRIVVREL
jgi:C-terminal processing protease CtpA/Prc